MHQLRMKQMFNNRKTFYIYVKTVHLICFGYFLIILLAHFCRRLPASHFIGLITDD